jgi:hypothetical protein
MNIDLRKELRCFSLTKWNRKMEKCKFLNGWTFRGVYHIFTTFTTFHLFLWMGHRHLFEPSTSSPYSFDSLHHHLGRNSIKKDWLRREAQFITFIILHRNKVKSWGISSYLCPSVQGKWIEKNRQLYSFQRPILLLHLSCQLFIWSNSKEIEDELVV